MQITHFDRVYIQPQWIFDCINVGRLLDTSSYLIGSKLPPHFSPFVTLEDENPLKAYVSEERAQMLGTKSSIEAESKEKIKVHKKQVRDALNMPTDSKDEDTIKSNNSKNKLIPKVKKVKLAQEVIDLFVSKIRKIFYISLLF